MKQLLLSATLFVLPFVSFAQGLAQGNASAGNLGSYIGTFIDFINDWLFPLALAIAFIFLVWGIVKYFVIGGDSDDGKSKGKDLIIYAIVGFVIIFSFYGLVNLLAGAFGLTADGIDVGGVPPAAPNVR